MCITHVQSAAAARKGTPRYTYIGSAPVSGSTYGTCTSNAQEQLPYMRINRSEVPPQAWCTKRLERTRDASTSILQRWRARMLRRQQHPIVIGLAEALSAVPHREIARIAVVHRNISVGREWSSHIIRGVGRGAGRKQAHHNSKPKDHLVRLQMPVGAGSLDYSMDGRKHGRACLLGSPLSSTFSLCRCVDAPIFLLPRPERERSSTAAVAVTEGRGQRHRPHFFLTAVHRSLCYAYFAGIVYVGEPVLI